MEAGKERRGLKISFITFSSLARRMGAYVGADIAAKPCLSADAHTRNPRVTVLWQRRPKLRAVLPFAKQKLLPYIRL